MTRVNRSRRLARATADSSASLADWVVMSTSGPAPDPMGRSSIKVVPGRVAAAGQEVQDGGAVGAGRAPNPLSMPLVVTTRTWIRLRMPAMTTLAAADSVASRVAASWTAERRSTATVSRPCRRFSGWRIISWSVRAVDAQCTRRRSSPIRYSRSP